MQQPRQRRVTVASFGGDQSAFIRAHKGTTQLRKNDDDQHSNQSGSQQELTAILNAAVRHNNGYDPSKVSSLDIDTGSYSPTQEKMNFLKKALSVSQDPFLAEAKRDRTGSFNAVQRERTGSFNATAK